MANSAFNHTPAITVPGSSTNTALVRWSGTGADDCRGNVRRPCP